MNWKLVLQLSLFGLAMAIATVFILPSRLEPPFWLAIFITCAVLIARRAPGKFFLQGFFVGLTNWVWVAGAHVLLYPAYSSHHAPEERWWWTHAATSSTAPALPHALMSVAGPILGVMQHFDLPVPGLSGLVIGSLAWLASKVPGRKPIHAPSP